MEEISEFYIKIDSFEIEQLNKLSDILENNQLIKIDNKEFGESILIKYSNKKRDLNSEFSLKIKAIRNKYYRNVLDTIDNILKIKPNDTLFDKEFAYIDADIEDFKIYKIVLKNYIDLKKYKENLNISLINYIGTYNFDNIFELTKDEMLELQEFEFDLNKPSNNIYECYGMYCHNSDRIIKILEKKIDTETLSKIKKCNKFILICPDLIREYCCNHFEEYLIEFYKHDIIESSQLFTIIYNKVLLHEIGHAVFEYLDDFNNERRANYFASLTLDGTIDNIIEKFTEHQSDRYRNPILLTKNSIGILKKEIYLM